jgi:hypothetical protein
MEYENIAANADAVAAAERLLRSPLVDRTHLADIIGDDDPYPEELLDWLQLIDRADQLTVLSTFDREYYLASNPDVAASPIDPLVHFLTVGGRGVALAAPAHRSPLYRRAASRSLHPKPPVERID